MSTPVEGGRTLVRATVFGIPVQVDLSFVVIMAILGFASGFDLAGLGLWLLITPVAVLVHELGHALAARAAGAQPSISLAGFGGLTTFTPPRNQSRAVSLGISLAGPFVGLAVGVLLVGVGRLVQDELVAGSWQATALSIGIFTSIGWSLLNLLPVLPLDGGQAMRELLPGSPEVRTRRAAAVSVVVALVAAAVAFLMFRQVFVALFLVFFAVSNIASLRERPDGSGAGPSGRATGEGRVVQLLWEGHPQEARAELERLAPAMPVDLAIHGAVLALTGDREQGHALLAQEVAGRPDDPAPVSLLALTLALEHDWDGLFAVAGGSGGSRIPRTVVERAAAQARGVGREDVAGRLTVLADRP